MNQDKSELAMYRRMEETLIGEWKYYMRTVEETRKSIEHYRRLIYDYERKTI